MSSETPDLAPLEKYSGETNGRYIVKLKESVAGLYDAQAVLFHEVAGAREFISAEDICTSYKMDGFNAFVVSEFAINDDKLNAIRALSSVEYVEEDGIMSTCEVITQTNAPWGLSRLSTVDQVWKANPKPDSSSLSFTYRYDSSAGCGVDVYVVDTGIFTAHNDFGGRARWGKTFGAGYKDADGNGHGTHCAGTIAGEKYGVAKAADVIAVKVLGDKGQGFTSDIISGLGWVSGQAANSGRPTVVSMSLGGGVSRALDDVVKSLINTGVHVVVAAGNDNDNANNHSPARVETAITVGASNITDSKASFSCWGSVVDVFAPGQDIISAGFKKPDDHAVHSGTSMACPHVAGLAAYLIGKDGNTSPTDLAQKIKDLALKGVLGGLPESTVNYLAHNAAVDASASY